MDPLIARIFTSFLTVLLIAVVIRALLSWFPGAQNNAFAHAVRQVTDPLVDPVRRVMPRTGMIDFSTLVVIVLLYIAINVVNQVAAD